MKSSAVSRLGFIGVYNHSIDNKGRVIVPQTFRGLLGGKDHRGRSHGQDAIAIYPYDTWAEKVEMLSDLSREDAAAEVFLTRFAMYSFDGCGFDSQGRVCSLRPCGSCSWKAARGFVYPHHRVCAPGQ